MQPRLTALIIAAAMVCFATVCPLSAGATEAPADLVIVAAVRSAQRSPAFIARDIARHPLEELGFFGLTPTMSVVEIWPGGGYWTEILAPVLREQGQYTVALPPPKNGDLSLAALAATTIGRKIAADPTLYSGLKLAIAGKDHPDIAPAGSVDLIVTFRNLHNWMKDGYAPDMFAAFFRALKPGGTLGIEDHRGNRDVAQDPQANDGYVRQDAAIALARQAGFVLDAASEIGANPKDTANWPRGVWTLPPDFAMGALDHERYAAVGEADNFVLKFRKP